MNQKYTFILTVAILVISALILGITGAPKSAEGAVGVGCEAGGTGFFSSGGNCVGSKLYPPSCAHPHAKSCDKLVGRQ